MGIQTSRQVDANKPILFTDQSTATIGAAAYFGYLEKQHDCRLAILWANQ